MYQKLWHTIALQSLIMQKRPTVQHKVNRKPVVVPNPRALTLAQQSRLFLILEAGLRLRVPPKEIVSQISEAPLDLSTNDTPDSRREETLLQTPTKSGTAAPSDNYRIKNILKHPGHVSSDTFISSDRASSIDSVTFIKPTHTVRTKRIRPSTSETLIKKILPIRSDSIKVRNFASRCKNKCNINPKVTTSIAGLRPTPNRGPVTAGPRKPKWIPVRKSKPSRETPDKWFPLSKTTVVNQPSFFPVEKVSKGTEDSLHFKFPWVNPLYRIFLQEVANSDGGDAEEATSSSREEKEDIGADEGVKYDSNPSPEHSDVAVTVPSNRKYFSVTGPSVSGVSPKYSGLSPVHTTTTTTVFEETNSNPFKMSTTSSSWPSQTQETASDCISKPILAPSKLTPSNLSTQPKAGGFGNVQSHVSSILKPPSLRCSRLGGITGGEKKPLGQASAASSSFSESMAKSSSSFKLKPSVLGGAAPLSPVIPSAKNPFAVVPADTETLESLSPEPETKKLCAREGSGSESSNGERSAVPWSSCKQDEDLKEDSIGNGSSTDDSAFSSSGPASSAGENSEQNPSSSTPVPTFVPLSTNVEVTSKDNSSKLNGVSPSGPSTLSSDLRGKGFIFGQNIQSRVCGVVSTLSDPPTNGETGCSAGRNLFTEAATSLVTVSSDSTDGGKTLSESSRELSEKEQSLKRKYDEVEVVTGEENEKNVIQMNCKLYSWINGSWHERGRGILRLNDREVRDELHSRLVIRTQGTLTVMLNAKIFAEMSIEKSNDKSVRFTATGTDGQPKIYLVMGSQKDIALLHNSLEYRVAAARSQSIDEKERKNMDMNVQTAT